MNNELEHEELDAVYITYDLSADDAEDYIYPGIRRASLNGDVKSWKVGEFDLESGERVFGVRITFTPFAPVRHDGNLYRAIHQEIIPIPRDARNVRLHVGLIPNLYDQAFNAAV